MDMPVFPKEFVRNHCPKVLEARDWRKHYKVGDLTDEDDLNYAECAFHSAGTGLACESCDEFLSGSYMNEKEKKFIPLIRRYYDESDKYFAEEEKRRKEEDMASDNLGAGI